MEESDKPPDIESFVVATIAMWLGKMTPKECENLAAGHFSYEILTKYGVEKINETKLTKVVKNSDGLNDILANRVVAAVNVLKNLETCPRFVIPLEQVELLPGMPLSGDTAVSENSVTSRLESLEKNHDAVMKALHEIRQSVSFKASVPQESRTAATVDITQGVGPSIHLCPPQGPVLSKPGNVLGVRDRSLSNSSMRSAGSKRSRNEADIDDDRQGSWANVAGKKPKPKVQQGKSKVTIAGGENAILPFDAYIGNTHPKSKPEIIEKYLKECFDSAPSEIKPEGSLEIIKIECCTKPRDDGKEPWCLNWRVTIDQKFRDYILNPDAIPLGWTSRRYYPPRVKRPQAADLHPAKVPNMRQTALLQTAASMDGQTSEVAGANNLN